ncbi:MAG: thioesterase family protein [Pseudanabaenaceae cyanobacterium SKYGB_i_bin29]|nr:acyl-CoA thioesterase [Pseudanabaenaceae cyanobacterium SKYG29]MDW8420885.1 thioesterase family protein [Pseudanabaenaceae cyanobacterium SKYGB_i_bin29]
MTYSAPIFTYQIDFAGHVNNGVYFQWLEEARQLLLAQVGLPIPQLLEGGIIPIIANFAIEYRHPLYLHNTMHLQMWCGEVSYASVMIVGEIRNEHSTLIATSKQKALFINAQTRKPQRFTPEQRTKFLLYKGE